jgi:hypothetical protein
LSPDDLDCISSAPRTQSGDFSDTNASDDGDYLEYKYGHYGRYFGAGSYSNPTNDSTGEEYSTPADDPNNSDNTASADEKPSQVTTDDSNELGSEKYRHYHYMPVEEQVGHNAGAKAQDDDEDKTTNPKDGAKEEDEGDDSQVADDDETTEELADDDSPESGAFTDAMLGIASQMADEWSGRYGMKFSDFGRLLGANK